MNTTDNKISLTFSEEPSLGGKTGCVNEPRSREAQQSVTARVVQGIFLLNSHPGTHLLAGMFFARHVKVA